MGIMAHTFELSLLKGIHGVACMKNLRRMLEREVIILHTFSPLHTMQTQCGAAMLVGLLPNL